jgi:Protein of Unknown function (DUF2784)
MGYGLLADVIVAVHVAYVSYVVLGQLLIWVGVLRRWAWVRNPWFRLTHLLAIAIVALEGVFAIECPLTVWERELRLAAGQSVTGETFIGRCLHNLIFYDVPPAVFTPFYVLFALVVLGTLWLAPPRRRQPVSRCG